MSALNRYFLRVTLIILMVYLGTTTNNLCAQYNYKFDQLSVDDGLKNSRVVSVVQDSEGYMWFATHNGLDKFNGADITHYSLSSPDRIFSNDDIINCLALSNKYDILCGTPYCHYSSFYRAINDSI